MVPIQGYYRNNGPDTAYNVILTKTVSIPGQNPEITQTGPFVLPPNLPIQILDGVYCTDRGYYSVTYSISCVNGPGSSDSVGWLATVIEE